MKTYKATIQVEDIENQSELQIGISPNDLRNSLEGSVRRSRHDAEKRTLSHDINEYIDK